MQELHEKLRQLAATSGMTQKQLAAHFGVSQPTISRLFRGLPVRHGPAHRRIAAQLEARSPDDAEYSYIHLSKTDNVISLASLKPQSAREANALDKLIQALNEYVAARRGQSRED
ncbi:helix-turn-helix transcriptional regulator [Oceanicola sp. 22II-s10i]|uniref:helix-turn-helix domain-containing protein n=1 Tax=Oceanicola sp. 22II-s10i TaxID=1317116 RepID=UPI000B521A87